MAPLWRQKVYCNSLGIHSVLRLATFLAHQTTQQHVLLRFPLVINVWNSIRFKKTCTASIMACQTPTIWRAHFVDCQMERLLEGERCNCCLNCISMGELSTVVYAADMSLYLHLATPSGRKGKRLKMFSSSIHQPVFTPHLSLLIHEEKRIFFAGTWAVTVLPMFIPVQNVHTLKDGAVIEREGIVNKVWIFVISSWLII